MFNYVHLHVLLTIHDFFLICNEQFNLLDLSAIFDEARTIEQEFWDAVNKNIKTNVRLYKESLLPPPSEPSWENSKPCFVHACILII